MYLMGGDGPGGEPSEKVWRWSLLTGRWEELAPLPVAVSGQACALLGERLYVLGGRSRRGLTGAVQVYDPGKNAWQMASPLPEGLRQHAALAWNGAVFCLGGVGRDGRTRGDMLRYDPGLDRWEEEAPLPGPRRAFGCAADEGGILIAGGWGKTPRATRELFRYRPGGGWAPAGTLPEAAAMNGLVATERGFLALNTMAGTASSCDVATGGWQNHRGLPVLLGGGCVCGRGERIWVAGGFGRGEDYSDALWVGTPDTEESERRTHGIYNHGDVD